MFAFQTRYGFAMKNRPVRSALSILAVGAVMLFASGCLGPGTPGGMEMLQRVNDQRAAAGIGPLRMCATLTEAAQNYAVENADRGFISHSGATGSTLAGRAGWFGYGGWTALGENLARGQTSVEQAVASWMASPGHRANIMNPAYTDVGFGLAGGPTWVQEFGRSGRC